MVIIYVYIDYITLLDAYTLLLNIMQYNSHQSIITYVIAQYY